LSLVGQAEVEGIAAGFERANVGDGDGGTHTLTSAVVNPHHLGQAMTGAGNNEHAPRESFVSGALTSNPASAVHSHDDASFFDEPRESDVGGGNFGDVSPSSSCD
jgi:hypothetical protein